MIDGTNIIAAGITEAIGDASWMAREGMLRTPPVPASSGEEATARARDPAAKAKQIRRGVKEVVKALKKGEKGLSIIAGDISPVEVICHVPILCEEKDVAYIYVPSKEDLGLASLTKRPTSIVLVRSGTDADGYAECEKAMRASLPKF